MTQLAGVTKLRQTLPRFALRREYILLAVLVIEVLVLAQLSPGFLTFSNLFQTAQFFTESGLIAFGMTLIIIAGGIDLSVGSLLALSSVAIGFGYQAGLPLPLAILFGIAVATLGGVINGTLIAYWGLAPLTVTLGTFAAFRGIALAITGGDAVSSFPEWFAYIGQYFFGGIIPGQLLVFAIGAGVVALILSRGTYGRRLYGLGLNEVTAYFSGVNTRRTKFMTYLLTGVAVGIAAVIYTSRVSTARGNAGFGLELTVIAAVVLGGANVRGGGGTISGTMLGVLILALLQNGLLLAGLSTPLIQVFTGVTLLVAVFLNEFFRNNER
ncbi:ABC transporter permease [Paenarthrobacter nicotinovorans]|uniref:ABC transporter permease n=1 Tax=Paenarthrobacter nicotinovorans TaxID=29320 RepID=UPI0037F4BBE4